MSEDDKEALEGSEFDKFVWRFEKVSGEIIEEGTIEYDVLRVLYNHHNRLRMLENKAEE